MADGLFMVFAMPISAEREEEFNEWYSNIHTPEVVKFTDGIMAGTRYRRVYVSESEEREAGIPHKYLAVYEFSGLTAAELRANLTKAQDNWHLSSVLDHAKLVTLFVEKI
jgi:hypothetical protein